MPDKDELLKQRGVLLSSEINEKEATEVIARLLFLQRQSTNTPIFLYINSPGGSVTSGLAIIQTIESLKPEVNTRCIGQAHSMAAIILASGSPGKRSAVTNAIIAFSEIVSVGPISPDKRVYLEKMKTALVEILLKRTRLSAAQLKDLFASSRPLTPAEARDAGIVDHIFE